MTTILKKEWTISFWIISTMFIAMAVTTIGGVHPVYIPFLGNIFLFAHLFQTDEKSKMNIHLASLPIDRKTIVQGRYLFIGLFILSMVIFGFLFNKLTLVLTPDWDGYRPISFIESIITLTIILLLCSFLIPVFYYFRYNIAALIYIFSALPVAVFLFGIVLLGEGSLSNWLDKNSLIVKYTPLAFCFTIFAYWLSYKISVAIFEKKDLHA